MIQNMTATFLFTYHVGTSLMVNNECGDDGKKQRSSTIFNLKYFFYFFKSYADFERHQLTSGFFESQENKSMMYNYRTIIFKRKNILHISAKLINHIFRVDHLTNNVLYIIYTESVKIWIFRIMLYFLKGNINFI